MSDELNAAIRGWETANEIGMSDDEREIASMFYAIGKSRRPAPNADQTETEKLIFVGYTNGAQISYVQSDEGEGSMYADTDHDCHIPLYMLKNHEHRIQTTGGPSVFDRIAELKANTDQLVEALEFIAEESDAGRHDGLPEPCPAHSDYEMWIKAREALQAHKAKPCS